VWLAGGKDAGVMFALGGVGLCVGFSGYYGQTAYPWLLVVSRGAYAPGLHYNLCEVA